jgi:murein DD-endopeptidase MepM/ murein hydrolase activator NlpD
LYSKESVLILVLFFVLVSQSSFSQQIIDWYLPINLENRQSWDTVRLTSIGQFGVLRKARPKIPEHLHTGADFARPTDNYNDEPIYPVAYGKIISLRDDGPFAQIIIEHNIENQSTVWSVYEHIAGIAVCIGDSVNSHHPIARFMNKNELDLYGWQFNHLHFEILKSKPRPVKPRVNTPFRFFGTYSLECYSESDLKNNYYNPKEFFELQWFSIYD